MPITYYGKSHIPATENTDTGTRTSLTIPIGADLPSMATGSLVYVFVETRTASLTWSVGVTGGQTWTTHTAIANAAGGSSGAFSCVFNGTWDASPRFDHAGGAVNCAGEAIVFDPPGAGYDWAIDVAEAATTHTAPGSPFDVAISGQTPTGAIDTVTIAAVNSVDDNAWQVQEGGWAHPGGLNQIRELAGSDSSLSIAYLIQSTATPTGTVTFRQTANGGDLGTNRIITFSATPANSLSFDTEPVETVEDTVMAPVVVVSTNAGATEEVTIALTDAPGVTLSGDTQKVMVAGEVTFADLEVDIPGTYTFTVTASGHASAESAQFEITLEPATHLFIFEGPDDTQVNTPIGPITIRARNSENVIDTNYNADLVVSRLAGTGTLTGTGGESDLTIPFVAGVATFSTLQSDVVEEGYQLRFESGTLTDADSEAFNITDSPPPSDPDQGFDVIMSGILHMRL